MENINKIDHKDIILTIDQNVSSNNNKISSKG